MKTLTCESVLKIEFKEEHYDELILPEEDEHTTDDITADTNTSGQCLYDAISDLSSRYQYAAAVKEEFAGVTPNATQQKNHLDCLTSIESGQSPPLSQIIKSSSMKHSVSKRGAVWVREYLTPPKKFVGGWCDSRKAKAMLDFLESFASTSRGSKYSRCANFSIACNGPRVLICEECFSQFGGLHDRYLKICRHYKTSHSRNCNKLIGRKLSQHHSTILLMISAWQQDTHECINHSSSC